MAKALVAGVSELEESLELVMADPEGSFAEKFYVALFARHPQYRPFFQKTDFSFQHSMLIIAMQTLVEFYSDPTDEARHYLMLLGRKHGDMGIGIEEFEHFYEVLIDEIKRCHGSGWNASLEREWRVALTMGARVMTRGGWESALDLRELHTSQFSFTAKMLTRLAGKSGQRARMANLTAQVNEGLLLEEVLDHVYEDFKEIIPYERIGLALVDEARERVFSTWVRSERPVYLGKNYVGRLEGSTLAGILKTGTPRIINDLQAYLEAKPSSLSTSILVREGMRSSLTCPLMAQQRPVGFLFFSSVSANTYRPSHISFFTAVARQLSTVVEKANLYALLNQKTKFIERQHEKVSRELEMAKKFQRSLIPSKGMRLPHLAVDFAYEPAQNVGGDFFDLVGLEDGRSLIFISDAMGHGMQAAIMAAAVKLAWNNARRLTQDPAEIMRRINIELCEFTDDRLVTAVCALIDAAARELHVTSAGHPPPRHFSAARGTVDRVGESSMALALDPVVEYVTERVPLGAGDTLVFVNDGILEAIDTAAEQFGDDKFDAVIADSGASSVGDLLQAIQLALSRHVQQEPIGDDITIILAQLVD